MQRLGPGERLETRRLLAGVFRYTDIDGDFVTVRTSRGTDGDLAAGLTLSAGAERQLEIMNIADPVFTGTDVSVTVSRAGGGDGQAAVGAILAPNLDLGRITVAGDLGRLLAGDANGSTPGAISVALASSGRYGLSTGGQTLGSLVQGGIGSLRIRGDVVGVAWGTIAGGIGTLVIGGSLIGGTDDSSGLIFSEGSIGSVRVGRSIVGGAGAASGRIVCEPGSLGTVFIGGSVIGGVGEASGTLVGADAGAITIRGNLVGGDGDTSGGVFTLNGEGLSIGGSILGGSGDFSGAININTQTTIRIGGSVVGASGDHSGSMTGGGFVSLFVAGSVRGGAGDQSGTLGTQSASLGMARSFRVAGDITGGSGNESGTVGVLASGGTVQVGGSLVGGSGEKSGQFFVRGVQAGPIVSLGKGVIGGAGIDSGQLLAGEVVSRLTVGGDLVGGSGARAGGILLAVIPPAKCPLVFKGGVFGGAGETSGSMTLVNGSAISIGRSVVGGLGQRSGSITASTETLTIGGDVVVGGGDRSGLINIMNSVGSLVVKGSVSGTPQTRALIVALGVDQTPAFGTLTIGGSLRNALVLAGYDATSNLAALNGAATIGRVTIGGDLEASSIVSGVENAGTPNYGNANDRLISVALQPSIGSVVVKGAVVGSAAVLQRFGIVARQIGSIQVGGKPVEIPSAAVGFTPVGASPNFNVHIVST